MNTIMIATRNLGKFKEIEHSITARNSQFKITNMVEQALASPAEGGLTFIENALIKARYASAQTGYASIADDSGLVVKTLNGEPGVNSAYYAGNSATDEENLNYLLQQVAKNAETLNPAHYHCTLVFVKHPNDPDPIISQARWHGDICLEPRGSQGFGYDPIFHDETLACTAAELSIEEKNKISHRGRAIKYLMELLEHEGLI